MINRRKNEEKQEKEEKDKKIGLISILPFTKLPKLKNFVRKEMFRSISKKQKIEVDLNSFEDEKEDDAKYFS